MEEVTEKTTIQSEDTPQRKIPFWQNPKIPIVVALVVVVLAILGVSIGFYLKTIPPIPSTPSLPSSTPISRSEVTITTDKTEYKMEECIRIEVKNEGKKTICFESCSDCPCFLPFSTCPVFCHAFSLERKEGHDNYKIIEGWTEGWKCENSIVGKSLEPGESEVLTNYCISQNPLETDYYRVTVPLSFNCHQDNFEINKIAYSNDFAIKKVDFPFIMEKVNFYLYPSKEIVFGNGVNTGETLVKRDLDGDGKEEEIYVDKVRFSEGIDFVLHIGGKDQKTDFWATDFSVVDIDESDNYQEVVLHNPGPSNDDEGLFFRYNGREIKEMGQLARWPRILGNGEVLVTDWMGYWGREKRYVLNPQTKTLEIVPQEFYGVGISGEADCFDELLYKNPDPSSSVVGEITSGDTVTIEKAYFSKTLCEEEYVYAGCFWYFVSLQNKGVRGWTVGEGIFECLGIPPAD